MQSYPAKKDDISIVLCGAAGQGVQTVEQMLTHLFSLAGYNLFSTKEYMSRVRGGSNSTELRIASTPVRAYVDRIDILFPLSRDALAHVARRITDETIIIGERDHLISDGDPDRDIVDIPFTKIAEEIGGTIFANIIAVGVIASLFGIDKSRVHDYLRNRFGKKGDAVVQKNIEAVERGFEIGAGLHEEGTISIEIEAHAETGEVIVNGGEAVSLGALAGGCNFISSYPMTPATSVLTFLAQHGKEFDVIAEQAEDEVAAINMALGAWYGGARAMVTTSGGGFALMIEGVSLAGMIESPIVIHLAQRPGPATGQPTRTEQGDLFMALFAGHGEFPRIMFAPGTPEEAFDLTWKAFNLADKYQVPVFVLTDQYFIDSYYNTPSFDTKKAGIERHVVKTAPGYRRYALTADGVSPRGVPGYGDGLVVVDSDEHDEEGHLTEDHDIRIAQVDKRLGKQKLLMKEAIPPAHHGPAQRSATVICWGSTYNIVREAVDSLGRNDIAVLHFSQVYPLHPDTAKMIGDPSRAIVVESNATGQFAMLLKLFAGVDIPARVIKYNGLAFSVEELAGQLLNVIK